MEDTENRGYSFDALKKMKIMRKRKKKRVGGL